MADELLQTSTEENEETRLYELGYHLVPTFAEEAVSGESAKIKDLIVSHAGAVTSEGMPQRANLAYKLPRVIDNVRTFFDSSYFGWVRFEMPSRETAMFERELKENPSIIRFILLHAQPEKIAHSVTRRMTFLAPKSPARERERGKGAEDKKGEKMSVTEKKGAFSEAELDKTIEELIAE